MTTLSNYISSLHAILSSMGMRVASEPNHASNDIDTAGQSKGFKINSMELTIPMIVHPSPSPTIGKSGKTTAGWLSSETQPEILRLLQLHRAPKNVHDLLQKTIEERSRKAQLLLEQEEVAVDQVLLDYAQSVVATACDAFRKSGEYNLVAQESVTTIEENFEQLTERLVKHLRLQHALRLLHGQPECIPITVETQKLIELPAHALTYIKLLVSETQRDVEILGLMKA